MAADCRSKIIGPSRSAISMITSSAAALPGPSAIGRLHFVTHHGNKLAVSDAADPVAPFRRRGFGFRQVVCVEQSNPRDTARLQLKNLHCDDSAKRQTGQRKFFWSPVQHAPRHVADGVSLGDTSEMQRRVRREEFDLMPAQPGIAHMTGKQNQRFGHWPARLAPSASEASFA